MKSNRSSQLNPRKKRKEKEGKTYDRRYELCACVQKITRRFFFSIAETIDQRHRLYECNTRTINGVLRLTRVSFSLSDERGGIDPVEVRFFLPGNAANAGTI